MNWRQHRKYRQPRTQGLAQQGEQCGGAVGMTRESMRLHRKASRGVERTFDKISPRSALRSYST